MKLIVERCSSLRGEIAVSADKSITHRGLIIGAIAEGKTVLKGYSKSADCVSTMRCLVRLNIPIDISEVSVAVHGRGLGGLTEPEDILDCGNSGTTMRLLAGLMAGQSFFSVLTGEETLRKRPMNEVIKPLQRMGSEITARCGKFVPLAIRGGKLKGISYTLTGPHAGVKSSILLAGLYAVSKTTVKEPQPMRDHTERMLQLFGANLKRGNGRVLVQQGTALKAQELIIPGDISLAAFFLVLGSIARDSFITLKSIGVNPTRASIIDVLKKMGANISVVNSRSEANEPAADLVVASAKLKAIKLGVHDIPLLKDELAAIIVAATQARGNTIIKGTSMLQSRELERIEAIAEGLRKMGAKIKRKKDGFAIEGPTRLLGFPCSPYGDHRIAMAFAIAGAVASGQTVIYNAECIHTVFPEFIALLTKVCGKRYVTAL
jgi:3-phosphoshikimate 1-carboxyvinyltransferase